MTEFGAVRMDGLFRMMGAMSLILATSIVSPNACAFDLDKAMEQLAAAKSCCASYSTLPVEAVAVNGSNEFAADETGVAYDFGGEDGISFAHAFALPASGAGFTITVRSESIPNNPIITTQEYFYCPVITVLDQERKPIAESSLDDMRSKQGGFRSDAIEVSMAIAPSQGARYIIIHTPQSLAGKGYVLGTQRPAVPPIFQLLGDKSTITDLHQFTASPSAPPDHLSILVRPAL